MEDRWWNTEETKKQECYFTGKVKDTQSEGVRAHPADTQNRTEDSISSAAH